MDLSLLKEENLRTEVNAVLRKGVVFTFPIATVLEYSNEDG